jgi:hypothetical protein
MKQSRRSFLKSTGLSAGGLLISPDIFNEILISAPSKASGLLFDPADLPEIRRRLELPLFTEFWQGLQTQDLTEARQFLETGIQFNNQLRHLPEICEIIQRQAFIYAVTGEKERGELARLALHQLFKFKKWDYFLEAGQDVIGIQRASQASQTVVFAADWLGDLLSETEQTTLVQQLIEKGCLPCFRSLYGMLHPDEVVGWSFDPESSFQGDVDFRRWPIILSRTNLRAVPMSALGISSIFLRGKDDHAEKWLELVRQSYNVFYDLFAADGSYLEGTGYCGYTSFELALFFEILHRQTGTTWADKINWRGILDFFLLTHLPTEMHPKGQVNFGDGGTSFNSALGFWVAKSFRDGAAQFAAAHFAHNHSIFSPIFYHPEIAETPPRGDWFFRQFEIGWLVATTGFEMKDFVVALRSGGPANHEHADRNSLILKAFGENFLVDQWHPTYNKSEPGWILRTSPAHNTILVDGLGHQYHDGSEGTNSSLAEANVLRVRQEADFVAATSDATPAYVLVNKNVKSIFRTILVVPTHRFLLVVDTCETSQNPAEFSARWFVENTDEKATIEIGGDEFKLQRPGGKLFGRVAANLPVNLSAAKISLPEADHKYPFVAIKTVEKTRKLNLLQAFVALPANAPNQPKIEFKPDGENWKIKIQSEARELEIRVDLKAKIPEFQVHLG